MKKGVLLLVFSLTISFVACKKEKKEPDPLQAAYPPSPQIKIAGTSASLMAISTGKRSEVPVLGYITEFTGTAMALFTNGSNPVNIDAGTVSCESKTLEYQGGVYTYSPGASDADGIDFGSSVSWAVSGKGLVPEITYIYNRSVPEIGDLAVDKILKIDEGATFGIDRDNSFTFLSSADSVIYFVHGPLGSAYKTLASSASTVTFTANELKSVGTGYGYVQVAAYNYQMETFNGYKISLVNEGIFTQQVTLK